MAYPKIQIVSATITRVNGRLRGFFRFRHPTQASTTEIMPLKRIIGTKGEYWNIIFLPEHDPDGTGIMSRKSFQDGNKTGNR
jgi:hypothetical protein